MSGGSYNYLCDAATEEEARSRGALADMAARLEQIAPGHRVTAYTRDLADRTERTISPDVLRVWKAVEWYDSNDWGFDDVLAELEGTK